MESINLTNCEKLRLRLAQRGVSLLDPQHPQSVGSIKLREMTDRHVSKDDLSYYLAMCSMYGEVDHTRATIDIRNM